MGKLSIPALLIFCCIICNISGLNLFSFSWKFEICFLNSIILLVSIVIMVLSEFWTTTFPSPSIWAEITSSLLLNIFSSNEKFINTNDSKRDSYNPIYYLKPMLWCFLTFCIIDYCIATIRYNLIAIPFYRYIIYMFHACRMLASKSILNPFKGGQELVMDDGWGQMDDVYRSMYEG